MRRLIVAPRAQRDIEATLAQSATRYGQQAARRYRRLIARAIKALQAEPDQPSAHPAEIGDLYLYALSVAARQLPASDRVRSPAHRVVFRFDDQRVEIVRLLHEAMDLPAHLRHATGPSAEQP